MPHILLADDDLPFCELLGEYLQRQGFSVTAVHDGATALARALQGGLDAMVLDVMMPGGDGFQVLTQLRRQAQLPVLMLTARGEDVDRIIGLELGADDYLGKPCNPRELSARLRAILRRARTGAGQANELCCGDVRLVLPARSCQLGRIPIDLTSSEFDVLRVLMEEAGRVVSKEDLARRALRRPLGVLDRSIDMHVSRLRSKLGDWAEGAPRIRTIRNRGYLFALPP